MTYTEQSFNLPELKGLSTKQIEVHLKLYAGYVKNVNAINEKVAELKKDSEKNAIALSELTRRYGFEWNGMRLHEYYFESLGGNGELSGGKLSSALEKAFGSTDSFLAELKAMGAMRGIGWVLLVLDEKTDALKLIWVSDHEIGHLAGTKIILAMDMWEHAFMVDYLPAQKGDYVSAFLANVNWKVVESRI